MALGCKPRPAKVLPPIDIHQCKRFGRGARRELPRPAKILVYNDLRGIGLPAGLKRRRAYCTLIIKFVIPFYRVQA
jgi:hypothetical protein